MGTKLSDKYWEKSEYRDIYKFRLTYGMEVAACMFEQGINDMKNRMAIDALRKFRDDIDCRILELEKEK